MTRASKIAPGFSLQNIRKTIDMVGDSATIRPR